MRRKPQATARFGVLTITYSQASSTPPWRIEYVREDDFARLATVVDAYHRIVDIRGQLATHPNEQARRQVRDTLGLPHPEPEPVPHKGFPLRAYALVRGLTGTRRATARLDRILEPWMFANVTLTDVVTVRVAS